MHKVAAKNEQTSCSEDKIFIRAFASACELKHEIRKRIINRREIDWDLFKISSQGPFITLVFKPRS